MKRPLAVAAYGETFGPCSGTCNHEVCKLLIEMAHNICRECKNSIGFNTDFTTDQKDGTAIHVSCMPLPDMHLDAEEIPIAGKM